MNNNNDGTIATIKLTLAWLGMTIGGITLSDIALTTTIVFTVLQIFVLLRRMLRGDA